MSALHPVNPERTRKAQAVGWPVVAAVVVCLLLSTAAGFAQELVDRVAAVVNDRVITLSDVQWSFLGDPAARVPAHLDTRAMSEQLDRLIEQELVAQEMEKEPLMAPTTDQLEIEIRRLEERYGGKEALEREAEHRGLGSEQLRAIVRRQMSIHRFINSRFRPFLVITPDEIASYYKETLAPQMEKAGLGEPPPLDSVREQIENLLLEQKVDLELEKWLSSVRKRSKIVVLLGRLESPNQPPPSESEEGAPPSQESKPPGIEKTPEIQRP